LHGPDRVKDDSEALIDLGIELVDSLGQFGMLAIEASQTRDRRGRGLKSHFVTSKMWLQRR
jgi:hypothetical protein